jgi:hypothetical protein
MTYSLMLVITVGIIVHLIRLINLGMTSQVLMVMMFTSGFASAIITLRLKKFKRLINSN